MLKILDRKYDVHIVGNKKEIRYLYLNIARKDYTFMIIKRFNREEDYERIIDFLTEQYKRNKNMVCWLPQRFDDLIFRIDTMYHDERGLDIIWMIQGSN